MTEDNKNEKLMDDLEPHVALANAIVMQACKDYRKTDEKLAEFEKFFRSDWYRALTDLDGEYLMKRIREEVLASEAKSKKTKAG